MADKLTSGIKIAVDTTEIDVKFLKSAEALNASLTKTQKNLGLTYNEQGLLTNALGQCVEGLSATQIKLGEYVDKLGNVRTYQGGLVEGLNKSQVAMGMYSDELGNVYDKTGALVGQTAKAARALEKEAAEAAKRAAQSMDELARSAKEASDEVRNTTEAFKGIAEPLKAFGDLLKSAGENSGESGEKVTMLGEFLGDVGDSIKWTTEKIDAFNKTSRNVGEFVRRLKGLNIPKTFNAIGAAGKNAGKQIAVAFATAGGPAIALVAGVAAVGLAIYGIKKYIDAKHPVEELSEQFKELEERARKAGKNIETVKDALQVGAFSKEDNSIAEAAKRYEEAKKALEKAKEDDERAAKAGNAFGAYAAARDAENAENQMKNAMADINARSAPIVERAREEAQTASQKLEAESKKIAEVIQAARDAEASKEDIAALEKLQAKTEKQLAEEKNKEYLEAKGLTELMAEARAAAKASRPFHKEAAEKQKRLDEALAASEITQDEYNEATRLLRDKARAAAARELGIDPPQLPDVPPELKKNLDEITERYKEGGMTMKELRDATEKARAEFEAAEQAQRAQRAAEQLAGGEIDVEAHLANMAEITKKEAEEAKKRGGIVAALEVYRDALDVGGIDEKTANEEIAKLQEERARELKESKATLEEWNASAGRGEVAQKAAAEAIQEFKEAAEEARDKARTKLAEELGVELGPEKKTLNYQEKVKALQEALEKGNATQEDYNATLKRLQEAEQERLAQETGAIFEKKKELDALAKYEDGAGKLKKALDEGAITQEAYNEGLESLRDAAKEAAPITLERFKEERKRLQEAKRAGELDEEEYKKRLEILKGATQKGQEGLEALLQREKELDPLKKAEEDHAALMKQIDEAEKARLYSREQIEKMRDAADVDLAKAREAAAKEERARLDKMRGELGIDKLLEDMKSPLDKYRETMDKIAAAAGEGAISSDEAALLQAKAEDDYWTKMGDVADKSKEKLDKVSLGQSMSSGSTALYTAMAKMSNGNFQNRVQAATEKLANTQAAALSTLQQMNYNLSGMGGDVPTFAGR